MTPLTPNLIAGYKQDSGLELDKKPFLLPSAAFQSLENAYVWRERVKKKKGNRILGRLSRVMTQQVIEPRVLGAWSFNLFDSLIAYGSGTITGATNANPIVITTSSSHGLVNNSVVYIKDVTGMTEINNQSYEVTRITGTTFSIPVDGSAFGVYGGGGTWQDSAYSLSFTNKVAEIPELKPGSVEIHSGSITFFDNGTGQFTSNTPGNSGTINYITGDISLISTGSSGTVAYANLTYYPNLPSMGIWQRELPETNAEQTIFWDTKYAYVFLSEQFQEWIPFTYWDSDNYNFFLATNYRGAEPSDRLFFETNFLLDANDPMRYANVDGTEWITFQPQVDSVNYIFTAAILIAYYGRLLALNVYEGATVNSAVNIQNRCRFSQIGSPISSTAWRSDQFGKGGFIDAPTNEAIISAQFFKNTLIVFFERSTWQLRYVGEYGLPFIWERISSDFGSESQFSTILFDDGVLAVGNRGIVSSSGINVNRIDQKIPDLVFTFQNNKQGTYRVHGTRDFEEELVFWSYADTQQLRPAQPYPNRILVYNYKNGTWATNRDAVTCFGYFQPTEIEAITWSNNQILWNNTNVFWGSVDLQSLTEFVVCGNNQGYIHYFHSNTTINDASMPIHGLQVDVVGALILTIPNHNLDDGDWILVEDLMFVSTADPTQTVSTSLNDVIFRIQYVTLNSVRLFFWNGTNYINPFPFTPDLAEATYIGGGQAVLLNQMKIQTKDINPYMDQGLQLKMSYVDFLLDDSIIQSSTTITLIVNSSPSVSGNLIVGNQSLDQNLTQPYYVPSSQYAWHRFYATSYGQFISIQISYGDEFINTLDCHLADYILNAMTVFTRPGGKSIF